MTEKLDREELLEALMQEIPNDTHTVLVIAVSEGGYTVVKKGPADTTLCIGAMERAKHTMLYCIEKEDEEGSGEGKLH